MMNWSYDVIAGPILQLSIGTPFTRFWFAILAGLETASLGLRSFKGSAGSMRLWFYFRTSGDALLPLSLTTLLCVMLSPSSDHHITPQIYISYEICGARRCSIPFTPSGRVILHPPFLSEFRLIKNRSRNNMMNWSYDVIAGPIPTTFYWHSFHPLLIRYPRWTRNCVTRLTLI